MHWMVCSVFYLGCMIVNINALVAEWRITECGYFQILLLEILSGMEPTIYFQIAMDAVTATFQVLVTTYFLNFRLALLTVLRALVHLMYLVIFNNFLVFHFPFFFFTFFSFLHNFFLFSSKDIVNFELESYSQTSVKVL